MTWGNTTTKTKTAPMRFQDVPRRNQTRENEKPPCSRTKPDEGDDEGKDEAEGESRRRRPRQEEEEYQRSPMPACHRQIRSDGKADEGAKYREGEYQGTEDETLPQQANYSDITLPGLCTQVQGFTLGAVRLF